MPRLTAPILAAAIVLASSACNRKKGPDLEEVIKTHRAAVEKVLDDAEAIHGKAEKEPPVGDDEGLPMDAPPTGMSDEVATEHVEDLEDLGDEPSKVPVRVIYSERLHGCARIIRKKDKTVGLAAEAVGRCAKTKYLLVVRVRHHTAPELTGDTNYTPGEVDGDALLYRLKGAKKLGAFTFKATSSKKLTLAKSKDKDEELARDLRNALEDALASGKRAKKATKTDDE